MRGSCKICWLGLHATRVNNPRVGIGPQHSERVHLRSDHMNFVAQRFLFGAESRNFRKKFRRNHWRTNSRRERAYRWEWLRQGFEKETQNWAGVVSDHGVLTHSLTSTRPRTYYHRFAEVGRSGFFVRDGSWDAKNDLCEFVTASDVSRRRTRRVRSWWEIFLLTHKKNLRARKFHQPKPWNFVRQLI